MKNLGILLILPFIFFGCGQKNPQIDTDIAVKSPSVLFVDKYEDEEDRSGVDMIDNTRVYPSVDAKRSFCKIYFAFDSFKIDHSMQACIDQNADYLLKNSQDLLLQGNCDETGSEKYNYTLGLKRAKSVKKALILRGVNSKNIDIVSFGKNNPTCKQSTITCKAKNRRVNFVLLQNN